MAKPIVFIPGFPASELRDSNGKKVYPPSPGTLLDKKRKQAFFDAMLDIPGDLVAGPPTRSVLGIAKQAQSLYDVLARLGYDSTSDLAPVGWDWRLGVDAQPTMDAVANAVTRFAPRRVVMLIHSTGALVMRAFLAAHPELHGSIEQVLSFGGAWCGTLEALNAVHRGESESILGFNLISADESANLIGHMQAAYDLFPPDPARTLMDDVKLVHDVNGDVAGANADTSWIKVGRTYARALAASADTRLGARSPDFGPIPMTNVAGWGGPTWPQAILERHDVDFLPPEKDAGDGTVPYVSTNWITGANLRTLLVPIGSFVADPIPDLHAHMWDSIAVQQIFREVLQDAPRRELIAAAADADEAIDYNSGAVTVRLVAEAADGHALPNCVATAKINGGKTRIPFNGVRTALLSVNRAGITHNAATDVFHFFIDFKWDGGSRNNIAVAFRAP
jgi:Lecithin:cholesterol acyltransferase